MSKITEVTCRPCINCGVMIYPDNTGIIRDYCSEDRCRAKIESPQAPVTSADKPRKKRRASKLALVAQDTTSMFHILKEGATEKELLKGFDQEGEFCIVTFRKRFTVTKQTVRKVTVKK